MKKLLFTILTLGTSITAMANSPYDVCESIRQSTSYSSRVTSCMNIVTQNRIDPTVVPMLVSMAKSDTSETLKALTAASNKNFQYEAVQTCNEIRKSTSYLSRVTSCLAVTANQSFSIDALNVISKVANSDTSEALKALETSANNYYEVEAINVCDVIRSHTSYLSRVTSCLSISANKSFAYGATSMCARTASTDTSEALRCLQTIARDYVPVPDVDPIPTPRAGVEVIVNLKDITRIKNQANNLERIIDQGNTRSAKRVLERLIRNIERLESSAVRY